MPRCKICGETVRAGEVMHVSCRENWEEKLTEREHELNIREKEIDIREGFLDYYYKEILEESKRTKRTMLFNIAVAAFSITLCLINIFR